MNQKLCVKDFTDGNNSDRSWRWGSWCASFERNPGTLFLFAVGKSVMVKLFKTPSNCSIYVGWHMCICIFVHRLHSTFCIISYNIYMFAFAHNSWYILPMAPRPTSVHFFHSPQVVETLSLQETLAARERQLREAKAGQECCEAIATCDWLVTDFMTWDWIHLENTEKCFLYFFVRFALFEGMVVLPVLVVLAILVCVSSMADLRSGPSARWSKWWHGGSSFMCLLYLNKRIL